MITVHHLEKSRSHRVLWLLEELGVPYEIKAYKRDPATLLAPKEMRTIHPLGKAPIVTDGDHVLVESGAIVEYLVEKYGRGKLVPPHGTPELQRYRFWLHYAEGSAMPPLLLKLVFDQVGTKAPLLIRPIAKAIAGQVMQKFIAPQIELHYGYVEAELGKGTWLVGEELTAADIQMSFPIEACLVRMPKGAYPNLAAFIERAHARPAWARAVERGGPLELF